MGHHEKVISALKGLIGDDKRWYDQILYVDANADLKYEFYNILYDLSLLTQPTYNFPYFMVIKGGNGDIIRGDDSAQLIYDKIQEFLE